MPPERSAHWLSDRITARVAGAPRLRREAGTSRCSTLAVSWLLDHPAVASVIAGASSAEQVRANAGAVRPLSPGVRQRLDELSA